MNILRYIRSLVRDWGKSKIKTYSAAMAFFAVFSTAPLLLLLISITGFFIDQEQIRNYIFVYLQTYTNPQIAFQGLEVMSNLSFSSSNTLAFWVSLVIVYLGGTRVFIEMQEAFEHIWGAVTRRGIRAYIRRSLFGGVIIVLSGLLLGISILGNAMFQLSREFIAVHLPGIGMLYPGIEILFSIIVPYVILVLMYHYLPPHRPKLGYVFLPALLVIVGLYLLKSLFTIFITYSTAASSYGAASIVVVLLLWFYTTALILLSGAKLVHEASCDKKGRGSWFWKGNS